MIHLSYLKAHKFKQLKDIELVFPERCCTLVEGLNEAGKSTLFEAIYFALYGKGLAMRGQGQGERASLIAHKESTATVELGICVGDTQLCISREISRSSKSKAEVVVITPDGAEPIRGIKDVNEEILVRLHRLDADALLASCFVQQKELGYLEELGLARRQAILLKLLNMERITTLKGRFKWNVADDRMLQTARSKYRLAEITQKVQHHKEGIERLHHLLSMAEIHARLDEIETYEDQVKEAQIRAEGFKAETERLNARLSYLDVLGKVAQLLDQNTKARSAIAARERDLERVSSHLTRIDVYERETLPKLLQDAETLKLLEEVVEGIARLELQRGQLGERRQRLSAALESAEALKAPRQELATLRLLALKAGEERRKLGEEYEVATQLEAAKNHIAHLDLQIRQGQEKKARLSSIAAQVETLIKRQNVVGEFEINLTQAKLATEAAQSKVTSAIRIEEMRRHIEELDERVQGLAAHEARLRELLQQSAVIGGLREAVQKAREELATRRQRLDAANKELRQMQQYDTLINWIEAKRDADARMHSSQGIADSERKVSEAQTRKAQAQSQERAGRQQIVLGAVAAGAGAIAIVTAFFLLILLAVAGGLLTAVGAVLLFTGKAKRAAGISNRQSAEADIQRFDRELQGKTIERDLLLNRPPLDLAAARAQLLGLQVEEPRSVSEAQEKVRTLAVTDRNRVVSSVDREQKSTQEAGNRLYEQEQRCRVEEENVSRQLEALKLSTIDDVQRELDNSLKEQVVESSKRGRLFSEVTLLGKTLPPDYEPASLKQDLKACEEQQKRVELDLAGLQSEVTSVERQIADLLAREGAHEADAIQSLILETDAEVGDYVGQRSKLDQEARRLQALVSPEVDSAVLKLRLAEVTANHQRLEREVAEKQARIDAEQERISCRLADEGISSLPNARVAIEKLERDEQSLATTIEDLWESKRDAFTYWQVPFSTPEAKKALASASSTVQPNIRTVQEAISALPDFALQEKQIKEELKSYTASIERNYNQLERLCEVAGRDYLPEEPDRTLETERRLLDEAQMRLALEDIVELKAMYQQALESKVSELTNAKQYEAKLVQSERDARRLLTLLGVTEVASLDVEGISEHLSDFTDVKASDRLIFQNEISELNEKVAVLMHEADQLEQTLHITRSDLDIELCRIELEECERHQTVCSYAGLVLDKVREHMLQGVLPNTLNYMRVLLPLLTSHRYYDVELDNDTYKIRIWDNHAGEYIEKDIFSGATQDQFSLALRLAFALATLPEGLGAQPKFIFLDEPTAGFDGERREAFVNLLTKGHLSKRFDQIFLISPEGIFNSNPLPDYIRVVGGRIVGKSFSENISGLENRLQSSSAV